MKRILFVVVLIAIIFATTGTASAKTTRTDFTGSEWCDPNTFVGDVRLAGPNVQIKHITQTCYDTASILQLTGTDYLTDGSLYIVGGGPNVIIQGKLRMESNEGGVWVGSWVLPANSTTIEVVAHGEGMYEGMLLHWFLSEEGQDGHNPFWGYILDPGN